MAVTTTTQVDPEVARFFDGVLLDRHRPYFNYGYFAQKRRLPQKNSSQIICRRYDNTQPAVTPLVQGVTPASVSLSKFDVTINVSEYGQVIELTDTVIITVQDQTVAETADILSQNMAATYDAVLLAMLISSSSQINCTGGVNGNTPTEITVADLERAVSFLMVNNGLKMAPDKEGAMKFGTSPVWAAYWALAHVDIRPDIKALANFNAVAGYSNSQDILQSEYGSTDEIRWTLSSVAAKSTAATPIYSTPVVAANAYGMVEIDAMSAELIFKPLGAGQDPLNQRQSMGWKGYFGCGILDDGWVCLVRSTKA